MRNIILSLVVVAVLVVGGLGGVLATWSDSETSPDNYIETGSVDLKVNGADDEPWGAGVPTKVNFTCMIPCKVYGPYEVELWNASQDCMPSATAYIHIKNVVCGNAPPKEGSGYLAPDGSGMKPEPELVAEYRGKVNCAEVPGVGVLGDGCTLRSHIRMWITDDPGLVPDPEVTMPQAGFLVDSKILPLACHEIELLDLEPCTPVTLYLYFHLQQPSEEAFGIDVIPDPGDPGYDELTWLKFNDWPSWALMKDTISFDMEFDLVLWDP